MKRQTTRGLMALAMIPWAIGDFYFETLWDHDPYLAWTGIVIAAIVLLAINPVLAVTLVIVTFLIFAASVALGLIADKMIDEPPFNKQFRR